MSQDEQWWPNTREHQQRWLGKNGEDLAVGDSTLQFGLRRLRRFESAIQSDSYVITWIQCLTDISLALMHSCKRLTSSCKKNDGLERDTLSQSQNNSIWRGDSWSIDVLAGPQVYKLAGSSITNNFWFPPTQPSVFAWMTLSLAIQDAFMLYQSEVTERKKLEGLSPAELSRPVSVAIFF